MFRRAFADDEAATLIEPLIERGRAVYTRYALALPLESRVIGYEKLTIVLRGDYVKHADILLRHVIFNRVTIYIMLEDATLVALMCPFGPAT